MEKRTLLAVALSLLVLYVYSFFAPKPQGSFTPSETSEVVDIKGDAEYLNDSPGSDSSELPPVLDMPSSLSAAPLPSGMQKTKTIESEKLFAEFSNIGGTLAKIVVKEHDFALPVTNIANVSGYESRVFALDQITESSITYVLADGDRKIVKKYMLEDGDYLIKTEVEIYNLSEMSKVKDVSFNGLTVDLSRLDKELKSGREKSLFEYVVENGGKTFRKGNASKFSSKEAKQELGTVKWVGFRDRYFCTIVKPEFATQQYSVTPVDENVLNLEMRVQDVKMRPGESVRFDYIIYAGPQRLEQLSSYEMGFENMMRFSGFGLFNFISVLIYNMMLFMNKIIPNWGICIILTSLVVYGAMYPLTIKGMSSMKRMQALQPKIAEMKEQYKNNPQKLNKEMMEFYKTNKVNPFGGCLPFLLQMPLFIGLYQVLWRSVAFKGANFLWIKDLSEPDRLFTLPFELPFIGNEFNILPICMMIAMAFQQRISSRNTPVTDPAQAAQQKMMMTFFPIFLGVIFYKFASGLSLYFTTFYLLSILTQLKISKMTKVA